MALGISSGMLANALGVGQDRIRQEQAQKANYANAISSVGQSIAGGIKDYKAEQNAIALEEARAERERAAREAFAKQAQDFQREMAERQRTQQVQDQELEFGRQARGNAAAFKAAGLNLPAGAAMMSPAMVGPLTSKLLGEQQDKAQASQFGSLMAPTPRMPIGNPLGFPGMPSEIPSMPATPGAVSMRAGTMKDGVDPSVFAKAMEGAQATYPKPKQFAPRNIDPNSPEGIAAAEERARAAAKARVDFAPPVDPVKADIDRLRREKLQAEIDAIKRRPAPLDPNVQRQISEWQRQRDALDPIVHRKDFEDLSNKIKDAIGGALPSPAPQGAPSGGDQPTPDEMKEWTEKGFRWDPTRGGFVR